MKVKNRLRRIKYLCYKYSPPFTGFMINNPNFKAISFKDILDNKHYNKEFLELVELLLKNFESETEAKYFWLGIQAQKRINQGVYKLKPIISKQDNKNIRVGSGGSNKNKTRLPKKKRKNAWKKFVKLFPGFKNLLNK